jgi:16S rRNA processing protein RimM
VSGARASEQELELGSVLAVFGVRGELRLHLHHPESPLWAAPVSVVAQWPDGTRRAVRLSVRPGAGKRWLGRIAGVDDRDAARAWVGVRLLFPRDLLPPPAADEFYVWQVEGAPIEVSGVQVGRVVRVHHSGGTDVFEIRSTDGRTEFVASLKDNVEAVGADRLVLCPGAWPDAEEE